MYVLYVGASGGIGLATARLFLRKSTSFKPVKQYTIVSSNFVLQYRARRDSHRALQHQLDDLRTLDQRIWLRSNPSCTS